MEQNSSSIYLNNAAWFLTVYCTKADIFSTPTIPLFHQTPKSSGYDSSGVAPEVRVQLTSAIRIGFFLVFSKRMLRWCLLAPGTHPLLPRQQKKNLTRKPVATNLKFLSSLNYHIWIRNSPTKKQPSYLLFLLQSPFSPPGYYYNYLELTAAALHRLSKDQVHWTVGYCLLLYHFPPSFCELALREVRPFLTVQLTHQIPTREKLAMLICYGTDITIILKKFVEL